MKDKIINYKKDREQSKIEKLELAKTMSIHPDIVKDMYDVIDNIENEGKYSQSELKTYKCALVLMQAQQQQIKAVERLADMER